MKEKEGNQWVVNALHNLSYIHHLANDIDETDCPMRIGYNVKEIKSVIEELHEELSKHRR